MLTRKSQYKRSWQDTPKRTQQPSEVSYNLSTSSRSGRTSETSRIPPSGAPSWELLDRTGAEMESREESVEIIGGTHPITLRSGEEFARFEAVIRPTTANSTCGGMSSSSKSCRGALPAIRAVARDGRGPHLCDFALVDSAAENSGSGHI